MVEGELARAEGDEERAILAFDAAVRGARALRHLAYEALAHERCAALLASRGDARARCSFAAARRAYAEWGADALVAKLDAQALHQAP